MNTEPSADIRAYVEAAILPQYDAFDSAHRRDHALAVIERSLALARHYDVNPDMVYVAAACHDLGLCEGREHHHEASARIIRENPQWQQWFTAGEIDVIACAAEDHRASSHCAPRSVYGRIVAEADRLIDPEITLRRTVQYGLAHYPEMNREQHYDRFLRHLLEKYAEGGYLKLWIAESPNADRLAELRRLIADRPRLRAVFDVLFDAERRATANTPPTAHTPGNEPR